MFYQQTTSTLVRLPNGETFTQCEICGRCYENEHWDRTKITRNDWAWTCDHSDQDTGILE